MKTQAVVSKVVVGDGWVFPLLSAIFSYVAFFSGRFSISKIYSDIHSSVFYEARFFSLVLIVALIIGYLVCSRKSKAPKNKTSTVVWVISVLIILSQIYLLVFGLYVSGDGQMSPMIIEIAFIIVSILAVSFMLKIWGGKYVTSLMFVGASATMILGLVILWVPPLLYDAESIIGVFSIYRIAFFGAFCSLYLSLYYTANRYLGLMFISASTIGFIIAYVTLLKAAFLIGVLCMGMMSLAYILWFSKVKGIACLGILLLSVSVFIGLRGGDLETRVSKGLLGFGFSSIEEIAAVKGIPCVIDCDAQLNKFIIKKEFSQSVSCFLQGSSCEERIAPNDRSLIDAIYAHYVTVPDLSFRIRLILHAMSGIFEAPRYGHGFDVYSLSTKNVYTGVPETYSYPHNVLLELLYSVGILGAAPVVLTLLFCMLILIANPLRIGRSLPLFFLLLSAIMGAVFAGDYSDFRIAWFYLLILAWVWSRARHNDHLSNGEDLLLAKQTQNAGVNL